MSSHRMYHPHHESQQLQRHPVGGYHSNDPALVNDNDNANENPGIDHETHATSASHLDHALLESLFFNEMQMLENPAVQHVVSSPPCLLNDQDTPQTMIEKEILRDFGVVGETAMYSPVADSSAPAQYSHQRQQIHSNYATTMTTGTTVTPSAVSAPTMVTLPTSDQHHHQQSHTQQGLSRSTPLHLQASAAPQHASATSLPQLNLSSVSRNSEPPPTFVGQQQLGILCVDPQATATAAAAAAAMLSPSGTNPVQTNSDTNATNGINAQPLVTVSTENPTKTMQELSAVSQPSQRNNLPQDHRRARQLVDQFATLASRLGIDLPDSVLQSLTSAAAKNDPGLLQPAAAPAKQPTTAVTPTGGVLVSSSTLGSSNGKTSSPFSKPISNETTSMGNREENPSNQNNKTSPEVFTMAPTVMELRKTAEEAIAAVTQSTNNETKTTSELAAATSLKATSSLVNGNNENNRNHSNGTASSHSKPTYSKRRKKPRLSDCEAKLAQLKAENEQLKRHLQNVSNKAHKFDKEKEEASKQMGLLGKNPNVTPQEMDVAVRKFSDMYSDYGVNRQQELSFHLDQLQRLVNPTNFTKMGLWTLGQSNQGTRKNPIAGILVKELDITPQQGRKILDQSEKIRKLCDNLKEAHSLLVKLKLLCEKKTRTFQDRMNKCTEILTAKQAVKLIIWINDHSQLLDNVCPGWGTEHIHTISK